MTILWFGRVCALRLLGKDCSLFWLDRFQAACPQLRILVLSSLPKGDTLKLLQHPAVAGFVLKQEAPHFLLQAIRVVASGGNWYSEAISSEVRRLAQFSREGQCSMLTSREQEVFDLLKTGKNNGDIAAALNISVNTVRRYVTHIYQKMGVTSRVEAILVDQALESRHGGA